MMNKINRLIKSIWEGKSYTRFLMNEELRSVTLNGVVIDIGGGKNSNYIDFIKKNDNVNFVTLDGKVSKEVNFETNSLPYNESVADTVLLLNVLEHIYNYQFLSNEVYRVLKRSGKIIGFVPFLMSYHPDPNDYFRYTKDALDKILKTSGFTNTKIVCVGGGPFAVHLNTVILSVPKIIRPIITPMYIFLDKIFLYFRPKAKERYPLGYMFFATK